MVIEVDDVELLCGERCWVDDRLWGRIGDLFVFRMIKAGETSEKSAANGSSVIGGSTPSQAHRAGD